jgi:hypothetical protein
LIPLLPGRGMLIWFVVLYLMLSIGIGLFATTHTIRPSISPLPNGTCITPAPSRVTAKPSRNSP